jgi:hypothetical protein
MALPRALPAGLALLVLGLASWALYGFSAGREHTVHHPNGAPPASVRLAAGHQYWLAVPGGLDRLRALGVDPTKLACVAATQFGLDNGLAVSGVVDTSNGETKFVDRIGSFVAARSGRFQVTCAGVGAVYVVNAADAGFEWSGFWLVLASAALVVGFPMLLSGLRRVDGPGPAKTSGRSGTSGSGTPGPSARPGRSSVR